jgi:hypothetical protein
MPVDVKAAVHDDVGKSARRFVVLGYLTAAAVAGPDLGLTEEQMSLLLGAMVPDIVSGGDETPSSPQCPASSSNTVAIRVSTSSSCSHVGAEDAMEVNLDRLRLIGVISRRPRLGCP